jgi:hypothetical protein
MLALEKFKRAAAQRWATDSFLVAVEETYTSTPGHVRGMRDAVLKTLHRNPSLLDRENTQKVLKEVDKLAFDLMYARKSEQSEFRAWGI